jgi:hypothetical protein
MELRKSAQCACAVVWNRAMPMQSAASGPACASLRAKAGSRSDDRFILCRSNTKTRTTTLWADVRPVRGWGNNGRNIFRTERARRAGRTSTGSSRKRYTFPHESPCSDETGSVRLRAGRDIRATPSSLISVALPTVPRPAWRRHRRRWRSHQAAARCADTGRRNRSAPRLGCADATRPECTGLSRRL